MAPRSKRRWRAAALIALTAALLPAATAEARGVSAPFAERTVADLLAGIPHLTDLAGLADTRLAPPSTDAADINGDGILDVLAVNLAANNISLFIGRGQGRFAKAKRVVARAIAPASLDRGDFNG